MHCQRGQLAEEVAVINGKQRLGVDVSAEYHLAAIDLDLKKWPIRQLPNDPDRIRLDFEVKPNARQERPNRSTMRVPISRTTTASSATVCNWAKISRAELTDESGEVEDA